MKTLTMRVGILVMMSLFVMQSNDRAEAILGSGGVLSQPNPITGTVSGSTCPFTFGLSIPNIVLVGANDTVWHGGLNISNLRYTAGPSGCDGGSINTALVPAQVTGMGRSVNTAGSVNPAAQLTGALYGMTGTNCGRKMTVFVCSQIYIKFHIGSGPDTLISTFLFLATQGATVVGDMQDIP